MPFLLWIMVLLWKQQDFLLFVLVWNNMVVLSLSCLEVGDIELVMTMEDKMRVGLKGVVKSCIKEGW